MGKDDRLSMMDSSDVVASNFLRDPYLEWACGQGVPILEDFAVDLNTAATRHWAQMDVAAAFVHLKGRGDFMSFFVVDLPPGGRTAPQRHLYEEVIYVLSGHGSTKIEFEGETRSFEWGPNSLFALPLNIAYQHFNSSGGQSARLISANNLAAMLNQFYDHDFIFNNPHVFHGRIGKETYFTGGGEMCETQRGRYMWETNFVADISRFELKAWDRRGAKSSNMRFALADGIMHAHTSEMPVGTYKKAHRHGPDFHVLVLTGHGYSLFWFEGDRDFTRIDWRPGVVFAPADQIFHQHFNTSPLPARYLALAMGSLRHPFTAEKKQAYLGVDKDVRQGGCQIEYQAQDPRVHRLYLQELAKNGVTSGMGEFIDESRFKVEA
jgi:uncharacterized RmlC-like cupin family protein